MNNLIKIAGVALVMGGVCLIFFGSSETEMYRMYRELVFMLHPAPAGAVMIVAGLIAIISRIKSRE